MNPFERACEDCFDAQMHGTDRRVFTAGALSVALTADDEIERADLEVLTASRSESGVDSLEHEIGVSVYVGTVDQTLACRYDVIGCDLISHDQLDLPCELLRKALT